MKRGSLPLLLNTVSAAVQAAEAKHAPMNSLHEGYAVLLEEVDELWDEVKRQTGKRDLPAARKECVQIAAMALRLIRDVIDPQIAMRKQQP